MGVDEGKKFSSQIAAQSLHLQASTYSVTGQVNIVLVSGQAMVAKESLDLDPTVRRLYFFRPISSFLSASPMTSVTLKLLVELA